METKFIYCILHECIEFKRKIFDKLKGVGHSKNRVFFSITNKNFTLS